jgi:hypothetical protein
MHKNAYGKNYTTSACPKMASTTASWSTLLATTTRRASCPPRPRSQTRMRMRMRRTKRAPTRATTAKKRIEEEEAPKPPAKKRKGGKEAAAPAVAPKAPAKRHLRQLPRCPRSRPSAYPSAAASRARSTLQGSPLRVGACPRGMTACAIL